MQMQKLSFQIEPCGSIPEGRNLLTADGSLLFEPSPDSGPFSLHPFHWSFELTTQAVTPVCFLLRYGMGNLLFANCQEATLHIPPGDTGKIYAVFDAPPLGDGVYCSKYFPFRETAFFDSANRVFALGDLTAEGRCVEFAMGQFLVIGSRGKLTAVYVQLGE